MGCELQDGTAEHEWARDRNDSLQYHTVSDLNTAVCVANVTLPCDTAGLMGV